MNAHTPSRRRRVAVAAIPLALLASAGLVYQASTAAFTASTNTGTNNWKAGSVDLDNSSPVSAVFDVSGLTPGDTDTKCVTVTYSGDLNADVRLYATAVADTGLGQYLDFSITEGTGGDADCNGFVAGSTLAPTTLKAFTDGSADFASGLSNWAPVPAETKTYQFEWTLQDEDAAMGKSAAAKFTWEAQNR